MREIIRFEEFEVEVWRRPRQKRMYLTVREDGRVRVTCNRGVSRATVVGFVERNRPFVARHRPGPAPARLSGDSLLLFGRTVTLRVTWTWDGVARVEEADDALDLLVPIGASPNEREAALHGFFAARGRAHLIARTGELAERTGLKPTAIAIRGQTSRWGSCTDRGGVSLNWKLVAAPLSVIDYVIIHELAHLEYMNHGPRFWALVGRLDPNFERARRWLRQNQRVVHAQFAVRNHPSTRPTADPAAGRD